MLLAYSALLLLRLASDHPPEGSILADPTKTVQYFRGIMTQAPTALDQLLDRKIKSVEAKLKPELEKEINSVETRLNPPVSRDKLRQMGLLLTSPPTQFPTSYAPTVKLPELVRDKMSGKWEIETIATMSSPNDVPSLSPTIAPTKPPTSPTAAPTWSRFDAMLMGYPTSPPSSTPSSSPSAAPSYHSQTGSIVPVSGSKATHSQTSVSAVTPTASPTVALVSNDTTSACVPMLRDGQACVICGEGTYRSSTAPPCIPCTLGKRMAGAADTPIVYPLWRVERGSTADGMARVEVRGCPSCPMGKYSDKPAQRMCHECPRGDHPHHTRFPWGPFIVPS
jgi:hypothetical protein